MRKLLITGASGFLGWNLCRLAAGRWDVTGVYCRNPVVQAGTNMVQADLTSADDVERLFKELRPEAVIHGAAYAFPNACEEKPDMSFAINVDTVARLAGYCAGNNVPLVFISTDMVFDGNRPPYREGDAPAPLNRYGCQKVEAEEVVFSLCRDAAVCRMPLMFGDPGPHSVTFIQQNLKAFNEGIPQNCFVDEFRTPVGGEAAAAGILMVLEQQFCGLLHLGGEERFSRYDFGLMLAEVFGYSSDLVRPVRQADVVMAAARPKDVSLDSSMAFGLGYRPGPVKKQLERLSAKL